MTFESKSFPNGGHEDSQRWLEYYLRRLLTILEYEQNNGRTGSFRKESVVTKKRSLIPSFGRK